MLTLKKPVDQVVFKTLWEGDFKYKTKMFEIPEVKMFKIPEVKGAEKKMSFLLKRPIVF